MPLLRSGFVLLTVITLLLAPGVARAQPGVDYKESEYARPEGDGYCFNGQLVFGRLVVQGGRCYNFYAVRTAAGGFLGFGPPGPILIGPGVSIVMDTPERLRSLFQYLIPLPVVPIIVPLNGARHIRIQVVTSQPSRGTIILPREVTGGAQTIEIGFSR